MLDFTQFSAVFPTDGSKPYDHNGIREIETFRKSFGGVLFIDRVLKALGLGDSKLRMFYFTPSSPILPLFASPFNSCTLLPLTDKLLCSKQSVPPER